MNDKRVISQVLCLVTLLAHVSHIHRYDAQTPLCRVQNNWELGKIRGYYGSPGAPSTLPQDTVSDRRYIVQEAQTLFRQNQQLTDQESIKKCLAGCEARIEIGLYYRNPYPRPIYLPIMGLATQKGGKLKAKQRMRKQAKPVYLQSHEDS